MIFNCDEVAMALDTASAEPKSQLNIMDTWYIAGMIIITALSTKTQYAIIFNMLRALMAFGITITCLYELATVGFTPVGFGVLLAITCVYLLASSMHLIFACIRDDMPWHYTSEDCYLVYTYIIGVSVVGSVAMYRDSRISMHTYELYIFIATVCVGVCVVGYQLGRLHLYLSARIHSHIELSQQRYDAKYKV